MLTVTHSCAFHVPAAARAFGPRRRAPVFKPLARCLINGEPGGGRIAAALEKAHPDFIAISRQFYAPVDGLLQV